MICECVYCDFCDGKGHFWVNFRGQAVIHCDDLDQMEMCEECNGSGIIETCAACMDDDDDFDLFLGGI